MKRNQVIIIIVGFIIIAGVAWILVANSQTNDSVEQQSSSATPDEQEAKPVDDNKFATLTGSAFDEAYIADMMAHHEGAVNMGEQALSASERPEVKALANEIVFTQSREMAKMSEWQQEWGFDATMGAHGSHGGGANDMAGEMMDMGASLNGLKGDDFDKVFLEQMIIHHQQAVDMSKYADTNAERQEIKDLARAVIEAQEKEISQMKQWQKDWGFQAADMDANSSMPGMNH
ncbi:DUF305 domain-containing protein [Candidatus Saccharibacteria bacterium]|nr:DUF305 domain-containing protein [Candidatus Saccharibacteria bacterium]